MRLSKIDDSNLSDTTIQRVVYSNIGDNGLKAKYALVFGNNNSIQESVKQAFLMYKQRRVQKIIFMGGVLSENNQNNSLVASAVKMKSLALKLGIKEEDILIDDTSNNIFENIDNAFHLIGDELYNLDNILVITCELYLKRCLATIKLKYPLLGVTLIAVKDGRSDADNWHLSDTSWQSGRSLATYEAHVLIKYAREGKILDLNIDGLNEKL